MGDHLALCVDRLITSAVLENPLVPSASSRLQNRRSLESTLVQNVPNRKTFDVRQELPTQDTATMAEYGKDGSSCTAESKWQNECNELAECRICQEEDGIPNLESPCNCSGSLKYAHRKCVQRWCDEKGDTVCEICQQPFNGGYTAPSLPTSSETVSISIGDEWGLTGAHRIGIHDPHIFAMAAERHFLESGYEDYAAASASGAACCRTIALVLMALLLLRHTLSISVVTADDDPSTFLTLFLLRAAGFLLPCYIMARAMTLLQRRRQRQEAAMAAAEVAILLQAGQARGLRFTVGPGSAASGSS